AEIVEQYAVGEAKLLQYSARGNLPCRRDASGVYFDLAHVARIFRLRSALASASGTPREFGRLRKLQLGEQPPAEPSDEPRAAPVRRQRLVSHASSHIGAARELLLGARSA